MHPWSLKVKVKVIRPEAWIETAGWSARSPGLVCTRPLRECSDVDESSTPVYGTGTLAFCRSTDGPRVHLDRTESQVWILFGGMYKASARHLASLSSLLLIPYYAREVVVRCGLGDGRCGLVPAGSSRRYVSTASGEIHVSDSSSCLRFMSLTQAHV